MNKKLPALIALNVVFALSSCGKINVGDIKFSRVGQSIDSDVFYETRNAIALTHQVNFFDGAPDVTNLKKTALYRNLYITEAKQYDPLDYSSYTSIYTQNDFSLTFDPLNKRFTCHVIYKQFSKQDGGIVASDFVGYDTHYYGEIIGGRIFLVNTAYKAFVDGDVISDMRSFCNSMFWNYENFSSATHFYFNGKATLTAITDNNTFQYSYGKTIRKAKEGKVSSYDSGFQTEIVYQREETLSLVGGMVKKIDYSDYTTAPTNDMKSSSSTSY